MRKRIFHSFAALIILAILLTFSVMEVISYRDAVAEMQAWVAEEAELLAACVDESGPDAVQGKISGIIEGRVTVIAADGTVLFESDEDSALMENHAERPEVQAAFENGSGSATRVSATFGEQTYYYAYRTASGSVIRVSRTMNTALRAVFSHIGIAVALIALLVALELLLARSVTSRIVAPINALDLENPQAESEPVYEELTPLLSRIREQHAQIRTQMAQLKKDQEQVLAITENMQDGLVVTDDRNVLSINKAAQRLFEVTPGECIGRSVIAVSRDPEMKEAFEKALSGEHYENTFERGGRTYQLHAAPVTADAAGEENAVRGTVILTVDISEQAQAENIRREFTANVSHELKTPLMSISGYAELIENGLAREEDIRDFAGRIHAEAVRLKNLVEDIIRLSRMEESGAEMRRERIDLSELCGEVAGTLKAYAEEKQITFSTELTRVNVTGVKQILFEMIYNLCDNAIKYNRPGGWAKLSLTEEDGCAVLTVADNGIGIAREHQGRVFERFYRVDKSHSRETGGTGLGLSIVKHGALLHNAQLRMTSAPEKGTRIEVRFPQEN